jgi:hypothetical protein
VDHTAEGGLYANPWLGLSVRKPPRAAFADLDARWPSRNVLTLKLARGAAHVAYLRASDKPLGQQMSDGFGLAGKRRTVVWSGAPALRIDGPRKSAIARASDDAIWAVVAEGPNAAALLDQVLPDVAIGDLRTPRPTAP